MIVDHIYDNFYHKISGNSMKFWVPYIVDFRDAIWSRLCRGCTIESNTQPNNSIPSRTSVGLDIPKESFRIFGFLDDTGFRTSAPGRSLRRRYGFNPDV